MSRQTDAHEYDIRQAEVRLHAALADAAYAIDFIRANINGSTLPVDCRRLSTASTEITQYAAELTALRSVAPYITT